MDRIRVMIVEDSSVVRQFLEHIIGRDPRLEVVAAVDCAETALRLLNQVSPDVISMDINLPGMNGFEATKRVMEEKPTPIVIVSGSLEPADLKGSMNALRAGALAIVEKPVGTSHADYESLAERLCTQLAIMSQVKVIRQRFNHEQRSPTARRSDKRSAARCRAPEAAPPLAMLGLVASTGGPPALQRLLNGLGGSFPIPIVLVQHIAESFHAGFVNWLGDVCPLRVVTAASGQRARPGHVYVAPADRHLEVQGATLITHGGDPVCAQRPSGTVLLGSMARSLGPRAIGVLFTGMGEDGAWGLRELREAGGYTIAEDASTAVVYGMPAAAVRLGAVCESLPLTEIDARIRALIQTGGLKRHPSLRA